MSKNRILLVDDEMLINKFLETRLKKENFEVDTAYDGIEAAQKITENKYDLILTDLVLPYIAGIEFILKIKESNLNETTPIIVLSSLSSDDIIVDVLATGAQDYIVKPFSINIVIAKIKQFMELNQSAA